MSHSELRKKKTGLPRFAFILLLVVTVFAAAIAVTVLSPSGWSKYVAYDAAPAALQRAPDGEVRQMAAMGTPLLAGMLASASDSAGTDTGETATAAPGLKLIYDAGMSVAVDKEMADTFPAKLAEKAEASGGYVSQKVSSRRTGWQPSGQVIVRVPAARLRELMDWIAASVTVLESRLAAQEITEQYVDLEARLANLLAGEVRLKELLTKGSGKLEDVLKVEQEIRRVRQEIDQLQGKKRLWDSQIAFSTLSVDYQLAGIYRVEPPPTQTFGQRVNLSLGDSWQAFTDALGAMVIAGIYALPWLPLPVLLIAVCLWRRRANRKNKA